MQRAEVVPLQHLLAFRLVDVLVRIDVSGTNLDVLPVSPVRSAAARNDRVAVAVAAHEM